MTTLTVHNLPDDILASTRSATVTTSRRYFGVQFHLEDILGRPVDLVTEKALRPELRHHIENEAVYAQ